ncbi:MAG: effector binding domain-containing protein [Hyphomonadaceae bacterium]|nr:effector binding domain-containing protein [Clostridia bacterium]
MSTAKGMELIMDYKIVRKEAFKVIAKTKIFTEENSQKEIPEFWTAYFNDGLHNKVCGMMGICIPAKEDCKDWKYGIGCEDKYTKEVPKEFECLEVSEHMWAIFKCVGPMPNAIQDMWKKYIVSGFLRQITS